MAEPGKYVTLVSSEGHEFVVLKEATKISPMITSMLNPDNAFAESLANRATFGEISAPVLEIVVEYFQYWYKNREKEDVPDMHIPAEMCLELLQAADYLGLDEQF